MSRQINLFEPGLRPPRPVAGATTMVAAAAVLAVLLLGYGQYSKGQLRVAEARRDEASAQLTQLKEQVRQQGSSASRVADKVLQDELARAEAKARNWQQLLARLGGAGIGSTEGHAKFLEALARQHTDGVWLTRITAGEADGHFEFALHGRVVRPELLSGYIQTLSREEALKGRPIGEMKVSRKADRLAPVEAAQKKGDRDAGSVTDIDSVEFTLASAPAAAGASGGPNAAEGQAAR